MTCLRGVVSVAGAEVLRADPLVDALVVEEEDEVAAVVAEVFAAVGFAELEGGAAAGAEPPLSPGS